MFERPSGDATSVEKMTSQKSASNIMLGKRCPRQAKGRIHARRAGFVEHVGSDAGLVTSK